MRISNETDGGNGGAFCCFPRKNVWKIVENTDFS